MDRPQLDYVARSPAHRRRKLVRLITVMVVLGALIPVGWRAAPRAWNHIQVLYWQRKAMSYSAPADQVVFDDNAAEAARLLRTPGYSASATFVPVIVALPWDKFYSLVSPPGAQPAATLFLHARRNSRGEQRLVVVESEGEFGGSGTAIILKRPDIGTCLVSCRVFQPGSAFYSPREIGHWLTELEVGGSRASHRLRWCAGQPDAEDRSHFTLQCKTGDRVFNFDGWLMNDDSVKIEKR